jgi:SAM-dependent methyltransferase
MEYKPIEYWRSRGKYYKDKFIRNKGFELQEKMLLDYLRRLEFKTVLELGAGFGRITNLVKSNFKIDRYVGVDISPHQLSHITDRSVELVLADVHNLPLDNFEFDLILSVELFLHIKPEQIFSFLASLLEYSDNIINLDPDPNPRMHYALDYFNFLHDYESMYKKLGLGVNVLRLKTDEINTRQFLFHSWIPYGRRIKT